MLFNAFNTCLSKQMRLIITLLVRLVFKNRLGIKLISKNQEYINGGYILLIFLHPFKML